MCPVSAPAKQTCTAAITHPAAPHTLAIHAKVHGTVEAWKMGRGKLKAPIIQVLVLEFGITVQGSPAPSLGIMDRSEQTAVLTRGGGARSHLSVWIRQGGILISQELI